MGDLTIYTPKDVATILQCAVAYVKKELRLDKMKGVKIGNRWRIDSRDLDDYINKKRGV